MGTFVSSLLISIGAIAFLYLYLRHLEKKASGLRRYRKPVPFVGHSGHTLKRGSAEAAGYDLVASQEVVLQPHATTKIPTGFKVQIPEGFFGMIRSRSSSLVKGIVCQGTVDSDYRGEIFILAANVTSAPILVPAGKAVAQMIFSPYAVFPTVEVTTLDGSERGEKGFGSTGKAV